MICFGQITNKPLKYVTFKHVTLVPQPDIYEKIYILVTVMVLTQQKYDTIFCLDNKFFFLLKCSLYNVYDYIVIF